jgi:hypothetical protein
MIYVFLLAFFFLFTCRIFLDIYLLLIKTDMDLIEDLLLRVIIMYIATHLNLK